MNQAKYAAFELQDFLEDDFFVQSIIDPSPDSDHFWRSFAASYPHKKDILDKAIETIKVYRKQEFFGNEPGKQAVWKRITKSIEQAESVKAKPVFRLPVFVRVAAAIILIAGAALWFFSREAGDKLYTIATVAGEIKTVVLPDKSKVILNGNSSITYTKNWSNEAIREVWIKGEGYFDVQHLNKDTLHIKTSDRFIVHCGDVNVEVLGTTFNVKARSGKTNVALITGKIRIDNIDKQVKRKAMVLAPGDYVEYAGKELAVTKKLAKPMQVSSWASNELSFTDATLREITETLRDRFGYTVAAEDTAILQMRIEGEITVNNVADLLDVVTTTLNLKVEQSANKHITISK